MGDVVIDQAQAFPRELDKLLKAVFRGGQTAR
ncbi:hypothetical protein SAMN05444920_106414 [Nonomuraea solani]|uniref:Uncharacterized protein n=1 Tax=Nonomuraea solani TaxID=1144553 RepID=A0A1H6DX02_9ACTN|nr:hypothetical protein SAMN05444920_106414 [Nonomuraea solani]